MANHAQDYAPPRSRWVDLGVPVHYVDHGAVDHSAVDHSAVDHSAVDHSAVDHSAVDHSAVDLSGAGDGPTLVCVHGLGGSLVNWAAMAPLFAGRARVLAVDLLGFGYTQPGSASTSVRANQRMLHRFLTEVVGHPAIVVGNSMGGMVSAMQAAEHPDTVAGLVLIDPALPPLLSAQPDPIVTASFAAYAVPRVGRAMLAARRRARTPEQIAMDVLRLCCVDTERVSADVLAQHIAVARARADFPSRDDQFVVAAKSVVAVLARRRAYVATLRAIRPPVLLLHGAQDRLVPVGAARATARANPTWRYEEAEGAGHVPQLEIPRWTAGQIMDWLATEGAGASAAARRASPTGVPRWNS